MCRWTEVPRRLSPICGLPVLVVMIVPFGVMVSDLWNPENCPPESDKLLNYCILPGASSNDASQTWS